MLYRHLLVQPEVDRREPEVDNVERHVVAEDSSELVSDKLARHDARRGTLHHRN